MHLLSDWTFWGALVVFIAMVAYLALKKPPKDDWDPVGHAVDEYVDERRKP